MSYLAVRPTRRCLEEDLGLKIPPISEPLDTIDHPLCRKAVSDFQATSADHERIRAIDDRVWFKVKIGRWRGAVWREDPAQWLGAAGWREKGSPEDFYEQLAEECRRRRAVYNDSSRVSLQTDVYSDHLLPAEWDRNRLEAERTYQAAVEYREVVPQLVDDAIRTGTEQQAEVSGYGIGVLVRGIDKDGVYVGIRFVGPVKYKDHAVLLQQVPGADPDSWFVEAAGMPNRDLAPGEVTWSNLLDPEYVQQVIAQ